MPSFSYDVKSELSTCITDLDKKYACLYGMLLFCKQFDFDRITLHTEHDKVATLFAELVGEILNKKNAVQFIEKEKSNKDKYYILNIGNKEDCKELIGKYKVFSSDQLHRINTDNIGNNGLIVFLAGAFLVCGSIIDPNKEYHLEFVTPYFNLSRDLQDILLMTGVTAKRSERKGVHILYVKESENIEDILTFMGATRSSLEIMNIKILKDVRNKANRIANCDSANIEKTVNASAKQVEDINYIEETCGLSSLSDELREIAEIRLEYPELSLRELGQMLSNSISRSGANHRMKKISLIAEQIRENQKKQG
ncbi:MAG TPA: DNA-binding protein WhiA [Oscillospiraceae bacterium]|nr:DNA-binding protein WhiA [Oscillospiraceae bacterium]